MRPRRAWTVVVVALAIGVAAVAAAGLDVRAALGAFVSGVAGDAQRVGVTLARATPLALAGLGVAFAFRAGLWNIGAEGQLLMGAVAAAWAGSAARFGGLVLAPAFALIAGAIAGGLWGLVPGWLRARRGVPEVIATILLNFVAADLLSWLVQSPLREAAKRYPQTDAVAPAAELTSWGVLPAGLVLAALAALALRVLLKETRLGLELRALGLNPLAARAAGVAGPRRILFVFVVSGALAGVGGACEVLGSIHRVYEHYSPGHGYTAIAVALVARLEPLAVLPAALMFGALAAGSERMQALAHVPAVLARLVEGLIVLASVFTLRAGRGR